jgi:DNA polymerase I-like protein with 3'-5' exonuclease and polymerase domains
MSSRFDEGEVIQVDFVSVEPRFARLSMGASVGEDVYQEISSALFSEKIERSTAKIAVLCALYGASTVRLQRILGSNFDVRGIVRKLRDYFGVGPLSARLRGEVSETGTIINQFGRKIRVERTTANVLVNNYIQSSSVDVTLLGFRHLVERFNEMGLEAVPIFLIHDALILDVPSGEGEIIREAVSRGVDISNLGNFPLKVDVIS